MEPLFFNSLLYVVNALISLFGTVLLLRAWMHVFHLSPRHPFVVLCYRLTQWVVGPLSRLITPTRSLDGASLVVAFAVATLAMWMRIWVLGSGMPTVAMQFVVPLALLLSWGLNMLNWMVILWVILSWVNPQSPAMMTLDLLLSPITTPIRRVLPSLGPIDLSPIVVFLVTNALLMIVNPIAQGYMPF